MDEAQLFERCKADLKGLGVNIEAKTVGYFTTRALHAYPVYTMDYRGNCNRIIDHLRILPDLVSCGRQGLFEYIFMDDAMLMEFEGARIALGNGSVKTLYDRAQAKDLLEVKSVVSDRSG